MTKTSQMDEPIESVDAAKFGTVNLSRRRNKKGDSSPNKSRRRGRPTGANAARERGRVKTLKSAFLELQKTLPSVPPDTKLSKLDVLVLATTYIAHLMQTLDADNPEGQEEKQHRLGANGYLHPVKKWPMRSRLYVGATPSSSSYLKVEQSAGSGSSSES
ncbi:transcription factor 24-like [Ptychodera flava]|uniref:transcription factor 24-like n=1 Tax=Ptychodera flava TaxID=63121 RepID=UPI003969CED2